jgi:hypothetical protein
MNAEEAQQHPRFVLLRHEGSPGYKPGEHWDLMFEVGRSLRTWALAEIPAANRAIEAEQLPDHRLAYLEFEGPISGKRGRVTRVESGLYELKSHSGVEWTVELRGERLRGRLTLRRTSPDADPWFCTFRPASATDRGAT